MDEAKLGRYHKVDGPLGTTEVRLEVTEGRVSLRTKSPCDGSGQSWHKCAVESCLGDAVIGSMCFAHGEPTARVAYQQARAKSGATVSLRGVSVNAEMLTALFGPLSGKSRTVEMRISLAGAEIPDRLSLEGITFPMPFEFTGARFGSDFALVRCEFKASFFGQGALFDGPASWSDCVFEDDVIISGARVADRTSLGILGSEFKKRFAANGFHGSLQLERCIFRDVATFYRMSGELLRMQGGTFFGPVDINEVHVQSWRCEGAEFAVAHRLGPLKATYSFVNQTQFQAHVDIQIEGQRSVFSASRFAKGGVITLGTELALLEQIGVGGHLRLSGAKSSDRVTTVASIANSDVGQVTFAHVSLADCRLYGAHGLSTATFESNVTWPIAPGGLRRRCIVDEVAWRGRRKGHASAWTKELTRIESSQAHGFSSLTPGSVKPAQIATLYRDLRRNYEARADQPGAADFYYGEMEMRRLDSNAGGADRALLTAYWIVSGYGLHATKAFGFLGLLVSCAATVFRFWGSCKGTLPWPEALILSLRSTLPGLRRSTDLTSTGDLVDIVVGVLGPILFALGLLALRARVRR